MNDTITQNFIKKVEPMMSQLKDRSNDTRIDINQMKDSVKSVSNENEKPRKKKKKETREATGAASAGPYSAPLFAQPRTEKSPESADVKVVREEIMGGETTEATATGTSTGQYSTPGWIAKNKKNWREIR